MIARLLKKLLPFILYFSCYSQTPEFVSEKIEIEVDNHFFNVYGDYYFRNNHAKPIKKSLYYPFSLNSYYTYPDTINVYCHQKEKDASFVQVEKGIYFVIDIPPNKTVLYKVFYSQKTTKNIAEYILTTTSKWGKPLEKAEFIIRLPVELDLKFLSYKFDCLEKTDNNIIYKLLKENFMPTKNLIVEWEEK